MTRSDATSNPPREPAGCPELAPVEPSRIDNPFLRFQTRAYWLGAIIRRSRAAEAERSKPNWFNR